MNDDVMLLIMWAGSMMMLLGFPWVSSLRRRKAKGAEPEPVCGCEHHLAYHTYEGACKGQIKTHVGTDHRGYPVYEVFDCTCQQYVGPVPAISPQIMRELSNPSPAIEPYSQDK